MSLKISNEHYKGQISKLFVVKDHMFILNLRYYIYDLNVNTFSTISTINQVIGFFSISLRDENIVKVNKGFKVPTSTSKGLKTKTIIERPPRRN